VNSELFAHIFQTFKDDLKALWYTIIHAIQGSLPWEQFPALLAKWYKEGYKEQLIAQENQVYLTLANLYDTMDAMPEPHQAWQQWLTA